MTSMLENPSYIPPGDRKQSPQKISDEDDRTDINEIDALVDMIDRDFPVPVSDNNTEFSEKEKISCDNNNDGGGNEYLMKNDDIENTVDNGEPNNEVSNDNNELNDEERMLLYEKAMHFKRLGNTSHALLCFLGCLQGLKPTVKSKFTMLPQCLTYISQLYASLKDYQKAVEFMQAAKLYYEIAIIEAGIQVEEYKKETGSGYQPLDLDPCLDEAKRANEYEKLSFSCLEHKKFQLALDYCGKATKLRQEVYGNQHPITTKSLDLFTLIYGEMGKSQYGEAMEKYKDLVDICKTENLLKEEKEPKKQVQKEELVVPSNVPAQEQGVCREELDQDRIKCDKDIPARNATTRKSIVEEVMNNPEDMKTYQALPADDKVRSIPDAREVVTPSGEAKEASSNTGVTMLRFKEAIDTIDQKSGSEEEQPVKLITSFQFLCVFILSVILSVILTIIWCIVSGSESCPSQHYIYVTLKYWYYVYFASPVDGNFF